MTHVNVPLPERYATTSASLSMASRLLGGLAEFRVRPAFGSGPSSFLPVE